MSAVIRIGDDDAVFDDDSMKWKSRTVGLADVLNSTMPIGFPYGWSPNPASQEANRVVNEFGGEILGFDPTPEVDKTLVY